MRYFARSSSSKTDLKKLELSENTDIFPINKLNTTQYELNGATA